MEVLCLLVFTASALVNASPVRQGGGGECVSTQPPTTITPTTGGTGPYTSYMYADPTLPNHVIYQPKNSEGLKLPVIVWGNGQCYGDGTIFQAFLGQVASHGVFVIASGELGSGLNNRVTAANIREDIDWAVENAGTGNYTHVNATRLGVWGQSCGGILALQNAADDRVTSIAVWNSGSTMIGAAAGQTSGIDKPIFYFIGGTCGIAYAAAEGDYVAIPIGRPTWKGNLPIGHTATFAEVDAGRFGLACAYLAECILRGNQTVSEWFTGGAKAEGWDVVSHDLDKIEVSEI